MRKLEIGTLIAVNILVIVFPLIALGFVMASGAEWKLFLTGFVITSAILDVIIVSITISFIKSWLNEGETDG